MANLIVKLLPFEVKYCYADLHSSISDVGLEIINIPKITDKYNNVQNFTDHTQFVIDISNDCLDFEKKFNVPSAILERIDYLVNAMIEDGSFNEIIPSMFELMATESSKHLDIFAPMFEYIDKQIIPIIENYKNDHIKYNCAPLLDEVNQQCLQLHYIYSDLLCISDFI